MILLDENYCKFVHQTLHYINEFNNFIADNVIASQFSNEKKNPIFQFWQSKTLISTLNKCRLMFARIYFDMGTCFYMLEQKRRIFFSKCYIQNTWKFVRRWDYQLTHLHIHIDCSRNVLLKITKIQNLISSLLFIRFTSNFHCSILNILKGISPLRGKCSHWSARASLRW